MIKKVIYAGMFLTGFLWAAYADAAPFFVTDITDTANVSSCSATIDASAAAGQIVTAGFTAPAGICAIDLAGITNGPHTVKVIYSNVWGETAGGPFTFAKKVPDVPSGARIEGTIAR